MNTKNIIENITLTFNKLKELDAEYIQKKELLDKELKDKKDNILAELGLPMGEKVILEILEYRDDRIHCFAVPQTAECFIHGVEYKVGEDKVPFLSPILKKKNREKAIFFNCYLSWNLKKESGEIVLSHRAEEFINEEMWTEEKLNLTRKLLMDVQKI